ncbi:MAG: L,D-transpeptidase family protein, partial [Chloroflexota bacterium]
SSAEFDSASLFSFDPAVALTSEKLFAMDEQAADDLDATQSVLPDEYTRLMSSQPALLPILSQTQTAELVLDRAGWPRTTAETTLAPPFANPPTSSKWVDVNIAAQTVTAYFGSTPIKTVLTSTGVRAHPTVVGTFRVWAKVPSQRMSGGSRARGDYYSLPNVPNVMFFFRGYSLHGAYWHRNFGHPMSHGCVNLTLDDAAWFYNFGYVGMIVRTHY